MYSRDMTPEVREYLSAMVALVRAHLRAVFEDGALPDGPLMERLRDVDAGFDALLFVLPPNAPPWATACLNDIQSLLCAIFDDPTAPTVQFEREWFDER